MEHKKPKGRMMMTKEREEYREVEKIYVFKTKEGYVAGTGISRVKYTNNIHQARQIRGDTKTVIVMADVYSQKSKMDIEILSYEVEHIYTPLVPQVISSDFLEIIIDSLEDEKTSKEEVLKLVKRTMKVTTGKPSSSVSKTITDNHLRSDQIKMT